MDEIGTAATALDEIITVDLRTRKISVPASLNREVGKKGESSLTVLHFRYDRYYQAIDFGADDVQIQIYWKDPTNTTKYRSIVAREPVNTKARSITDDAGTSELVEFEWEIPQAIINRGSSFEFAVCLTKGTLIWYSDTCSEFRVGTSLNSEGVPPVDEEEPSLRVVDSDELNEALTGILGTGTAPDTESLTIA